MTWICFVERNAGQKKMKHRTLLSAGLTAFLVYAPAASYSNAQAAATGLATQAVPGSAIPGAAPVSGEELRSRYAGKLIFLRGSYLGDEINFDKNGKIIGSPAIGSFTLSAFEVRTITLSKKKLDIEADRYGLHFRGALPFEDAAPAYDPVKISDRPVHISVARQAFGSQGNLVLNRALDNIFAGEVDPRMLSQLPSYWQNYFASKQERRLFRPADSTIKVFADGMTPPRVLNRIEPGSNEFAHQHGIAGMEMLRTVVDANGVPREIAISRPIGFGLDEKAVETVRNSHFTPAMVHGQPVPVIIDLVITFRIYDNATTVAKAERKDTVLAASVAAAR